ncbi:Squalene/phytoene synthase-domain-containing protein [Radiomyces spectabilis]|uniref:Squalene/phytoene synthase-domain-containing protein n=1 Tax=Radiomyces spectabilis TaxID=64574 RepID=UPI00221FDB52|nr:Squalene/phytoene synthase-domain-containing protein [Radiomyces spectabilis]KAI8393657.1 Squalene/phytoene synthase-domain-containing protein [Radiomyces spectabilis]
MGGLWYLSGSYLLRRCQSLVTTSLMVAIMGTLSSQRSPIESQMLSTWTFLDWTAYGFLVAMACSVLDHLDALMNTYPHLVTCDTKWITKMQNPLTHEYWFAMIQLVANLPAETDLNAGPIDDLKTAIRLLGPASRSWKTMAALFPVNLRQDLCLIYAFFRIADDLVDDAPTPEECRENLAIIRRFLREAFSNNDKVQQQPSNNIANDATLPNHINWTLYAELLPSEDVLSVFRSFARVAHYLCPRAMFELTDAWEMDLNGAPIRSQEELLRYAALISGTFGELCTCVIMYKTGRGNWNGADTVARDNTVLARARATGQCLQLINIARDVIADSLVGRCYVPLQYMSNPSTEYSMLKHSREPQQIGDHILKTYALRILDLSDQITDQAQRGINGLPEEVQDAIRAAFEIYMAIAPTLRNHSGFPLRTKVPKPKQQWIALRCIYGFHGPVARAIHSMGCRFLSAPRGLSAFIKLAPLPKKKL